MLFAVESMRCHWHISVYRSPDDAQCFRFQSLVVRHTEPDHRCTDLYVCPIRLDAPKHCNTIQSKNKLFLSHSSLHCESKSKSRLTVRVRQSNSLHNEMRLLHIDRSPQSPRIDTTQVERLQNRIKYFTFSTNVVVCLETMMILLANVKYRIIHKLSVCIVSFRWSKRSQAIWQPTTEQPAWSMIAAKCQTGLTVHTTIAMAWSECWKNASQTRVTALRTYLWMKANGRQPKASCFFYLARCGSNVRINLVIYKIYCLHMKLCIGEK